MRFKVLLFLVANLIAFRLSYAVTHTNDSLAEYRPIPYTQKDRDLLIKLDERTKYLEQLINERTNYLNERIDTYKNK